jgi:DNA-binding NarL/FixJ family response regulator
MYKVLIVDDHEFTSDSLEAMLNSTGEFAVAGKISSALEAESFCKDVLPDLVFMDIVTQDGASGLEAIKTLREKHPDIKIIAISGFEEVTYAPRAEAMGVHAFLSKSSSRDHFMEVTRLVMQGSTFFSKQKGISLPKGEIFISPREMEILRLMCKPMNRREIALELGISEETVKFHKKNMLLKTGFTRLMDLAFYVVNRGFINPLY